MHEPMIKTDVFCYRFENPSNQRGFQRRRTEALAEIDSLMSDVDGYARPGASTDGVVEFDVPESALLHFGKAVSRACEAHGVVLI